MAQVNPQLAQQLDFIQSQAAKYEEYRVSFVAEYIVAEHRSDSFGRNSRSCRRRRKRATTWRCGKRGSNSTGAFAPGVSIRGSSTTLWFRKALFVALKREGERQGKEAEAVYIEFTRKRKGLMNSTNPRIVLRNHIAQVSVTRKPRKCRLYARHCRRKQSQLPTRGILLLRKACWRRCTIPTGISQKLDLANHKMWRSGWCMWMQLGAASHPFLAIPSLVLQRPWSKSSGRSRQVGHANSALAVPPKDPFRLSALVLKAIQIT